MFQLLQDLDGSPMLVLDGDGTPVEFLRYDAYGGFERVSQVDQSTVSQCVSSAAGGCRSIHGNLIGYKASLYHGWTNLNEMRHRLYSSDLRQFLSMDPLGLIDSVDEWLFVRGDPINFSDRFGLAAEHARTPTGGPAWDPLVESSPETRAMEQDVWGGSTGGSNPLAGVPRHVGPMWPAPRLEGGIQPAIGALDENPITLASAQVRSIEECISLGGGAAFQRCMGATDTGQDYLRRQHEDAQEHIEENRGAYVAEVASAGFIPGLLGLLRGLPGLRSLRWLQRAPADPEQLLRPGGRLVGTPGSSRRIREISGPDPPARAAEFFRELSRGGTPVTGTTYPGTLVDLPRGGRVGYRPVSTSGEPTIDVWIEGIGITEIKFVR